MKYTGTIYRPPIEANTLLLQVTVGCAHNKCSYCTMYKDVRFSTESLEQIEKDLQEASEVYGDLRRIFLINGDAFVLSANRLKPIAELIIKYFPNIEIITMYAAIRNIMDKTDKELEELYNLRINDLWVGLETGHEETLKNMNKGFTLKDSYEQLERLNKAKIRHNGILMLGSSGKGKGIEAAIDTVKLINKTKPQLLGVTTLGFFDGSKITEDVKNKTFIPATELEVLEEEKKIIELIKVEDIPFYGSHPINATSITGLLPRDKEKMIKIIDDSIKNTDEKLLNGVTKRNSL